MSTISYRHHERLQIGQIAAALAATGFVALGVFQLALALGAPFGHAAWGGTAADLTSGQGSAAPCRSSSTPLPQLLFSRAWAYRTGRERPGC